MPYNQANDSANRVRLSLLVLTVSVFILMFQYPAFADGADEDPQRSGMVVTGKRPGPPLWKVTNQGNVLVGIWHAGLSTKNAAMGSSQCEVYSFRV